MAAEPLALAVTEVVVGVDGSAGSEEALAWSLHEARRRACPLRALTVWQTPSIDPREIKELSVMTSTAELEDAILRDLAATVTAVVARTGTQDVPVTPQMRYGHPAKALIDTAGRDQLLVVGSRGRGAIAGTLLGSVSQLCAQYARGPVVVVRGQRPQQSGGGRVVVGVDGSTSSVNAMRFAAQAAAVRAGVLHVVHGWLDTVSGYGGSLWRLPHQTLEQEAATVMDDSLRRGLGDTPNVDVRPHLVKGLDYSVLLDAAEGADLLVVGSRGRGGWKGLLLGSVSLHCVTRSPCPVAVIHSAENGAEGPA